MEPTVELIREYIESKKQIFWGHNDYYLTSKNTVKKVTIDDILEINQELEQGWPIYIMHTKGQKYNYIIIFLDAYIELKNKGISDKYISLLSRCINQDQIKTKKILKFYSKFDEYSRQRIIKSFKPDEIKDYLLKEKYSFIKARIPETYLDVLQEHPKFKELVNYYSAFSKYPQYLDAQKVSKNEKQVLEILNQKSLFDVIKKKVDWNQTVKGKIPLFIGYLDNKSDSEIIEYVAKNTDYNLLITKVCSERSKNAITVLQHLAHPDRFRVLEAVYKFKEN